MRAISIPGLLIAAVWALVNLVGVGAASADVLCLDIPNGAGECPTSFGNPLDYASGVTYESVSHNPTFTIVGSSIASKVTCEESKLTFKTTSTGSNTPGKEVTGQVTTLDFVNNCKTDSGLSCTVSESKGYTTTQRATGDKGSGTFVYRGAIKTRIVCSPAFFVCEYEPTLAGIDMTFSGSPVATLTASSQPLSHVPGGIGCGTETKFDGTYEITSPAGVYIATKNA